MEWWNYQTKWSNERRSKIFRQQEDYYDATDSEIEFREDLVKRQEIMDKNKNRKKTNARTIQRYQ